MNKISITIPARIASSRLPGKMLKKLGDKPVIQHTIERAKCVRNCYQIFVVTDSPEIARLAESLDVHGLLTSPECRSGTERIVSVLDKISGDWIFNLQGDEPFVDPRLIETLMDNSSLYQTDLVTAIYRIHDLEEVFNPNVVKVVCDHAGYALYFSRNPIPYCRNVPQNQWLTKQTFWGHLGIYGYRRDVLERYYQLKSSDLEQAESLEQLRFLFNGYRIKTYETKGKSVAIDTSEDLAKAEALLHLSTK